MTAVADFRTWVADRIKDGAAFLSTADVDAGLTEALQIYSRDRPYIQIGDITGSGTYEYSLPTAWVPEISDLISIEFPAGEQVPSMMSESDWLIYRTATGTHKLRLLADTPASTQTMRLTFTGQHAVGATTSTVYASDEQAVANLAASKALRKLGARSAQSTDSTLGADAVSYPTASQAYTQLADRLERAYRDFIGGTAEALTPAVAAVRMRDFDARFAWGEHRLFHGRNRGIR